MWMTGVAIKANIKDLNPGQQLWSKNYKRTKKCLLEKFLVFVVVVMVVVVVNPVCLLQATQFRSWSWSWLSQFFWKKFVYCRQPSSCGRGRGCGPRPHGFARAPRMHGLANISLFSNALDDLSSNFVLFKFLLLQKNVCLKNLPTVLLHLPIF